MPVGEAVALFGDDEAEPFEAFEVFGDGVEFFLVGAEAVAAISRLTFRRFDVVGRSKAASVG